MTDLDIVDNDDAAAVRLAAVPEALRFDVEDRSRFEDRPDDERLDFALGDRVLTAFKPLEYTMLMLGAAMSGMADGPDRAYAIMMFCHDVFDGPTRDVVKKLPGDKLMDLIEGICVHWGEDTSNWQREQAANRAARRANARTSRRR